MFPLFLVIIVPNAPPIAASPVTKQPNTIRVGGNVQKAKLVRKVEPVYPPEAKAAHVEGTVTFAAIIGTDGTVQNLQLVSGPPLLVSAAEDAVKQWVYKPTQVNGDFVRVVTQISIQFLLR